MHTRTQRVIKNSELRIKNFVGESLPLGCTSLQPTPSSGVCTPPGKLAYTPRNAPKLGFKEEL